MSRRSESVAQVRPSPPGDAPFPLFRPVPEQVHLASGARILPRWAVRDRDLSLVKLVRLAVLVHVIDHRDRREERGACEEHETAGEPPAVEMIGWCREQPDE